MLTAASLARFHASFANYATKKTLYDGRPYSFLDDHDHLMKEPTFCDSPWLTAAATLSANFLQTFSVKRDQYPANLKDIIFKMFLEACDTLTEYEETLNVLIHKDLWVNNIMFKYCGDVPVNALLIDFQCMRYGPPAFDLMIFLYLTTARQFRERHEAEIFKHYYTIFCDSLEDATKERLKDLNYDYENFLDWCDRSRMFALFEAVGIFPYVLMEPATAQKTFDDPETYMHYCEVDRTKPVVQHCRNSRVYLERQLEVNEEFVERYVLKQP